MEPNTETRVGHEVIRFAERVVCQIVTTAAFRRPQNQKRCDIHKYHVWRWRGGPKAPIGLKCQCGLMSDPPEGGAA